MKRIFISIFSLAIILNAANPLDFREYTQTFTLEYPTEADAKQASVSVKPLPQSYKIAVSSRWDDTSPNHLKTHAIMARHKVKGTFYCNNAYDILKKFPNYFKTLMSDGSSIGLHTVSHPRLPYVNSFEHFREFMLNRIQLETVTQSTINSQALPFCHWQSNNPTIPLSIGHAMMAVGVISAPDVFYPSNEHRIGYPRNALAQSKFFTPGDRLPDIEKMEQLLKSVSTNEKDLAIQPSFSMALHSWHTAEGLEKLDVCYKMLADNPNWWYCNQNEYGAYRYEALNATVQQTQAQNKLTVTVTRCLPAELGANVPLWFQINGPKPNKATNATITEHGIELKHTRQLPEIFDAADENGDAKIIPFAKLKLTRKNNIWTASLHNQDMLPLENLQFTFRFPYACEKHAIRKDAQALGPQASVAVSVTQQIKQDTFFKYGNPYYAVQLDFTRGTKNYRLYADLKEQQQEELPLTMAQAAKLLIDSDRLDLKVLAQPTMPISIDTVPFHVSKNIEPATLVCNTKDNKLNKENAKLVAIVDFIAQSDKPAEFTTSLPAVTFNGQTVKATKGKLTLKPNTGRNRILFKTQAGKAAQFFLPNDSFAFVK